MKNARLVVMLVVGAALIGGAAVYKVRSDGVKAAEFQARAVEMIKTADAYKAAPEYVGGLVEASADAAGGAAGLFGSLSEEKYFTALFQAVVDGAEKDGKQEVARSVRAFAVGRGYVEVKVK